jgi:hypothetical protein
MSRSGPGPPPSLNVHVIQQPLPKRAGTPWKKWSWHMLMRFITFSTIQNKTWWTAGHPFPSGPLPAPFEPAGVDAIGKVANETQGEKKCKKMPSIISGGPCPPPDAKSTSYWSMHVSFLPSNSEPAPEAPIRWCAKGGKENPSGPQKPLSR